MTAISSTAMDLLDGDLRNVDGVVTYKFSCGECTVTLMCKKHEHWYDSGDSSGFAPPGSKMSYAGSCSGCCKISYGRQWCRLHRDLDDSVMCGHVASLAGRSGELHHHNLDPECLDKSRPVPYK